MPQIGSGGVAGVSNRHAPIHPPPPSSLKSSVLPAPFSPPSFAFPWEYLDALEQTLMVRRLLPWYVNVGKRLVKPPKIDFGASGIFHALMGIGMQTAPHTHPKLAASWEGFALEQILRTHPGEDAYFYAIHSGSELDLFFPRLGLGVEIKYQDAPRLTRS
ncbi:MAG: DUF4143 domain-containing protein [Akkermansiaceae bacterium]|nr:DUF4143 domain-containing protein [Akkermansiaceae bacterium]